jgi:hypothetical protein
MLAAVAFASDGTTSTFEDDGLSFDPCARAVRRSRRRSTTHPSAGGHAGQDVAACPA